MLEYNYIILNCVISCLVFRASIWFMYHGLMRQSRYFGFGTFGTATVFAVTDFPAFLLILFIFDVLGRKCLIFSSLLFGGVMLLVSTINPLGKPRRDYHCYNSLFMSACHSLMNWFLKHLPIYLISRGKLPGTIDICGMILLSNLNCSYYRY